MRRFRRFRKYFIPGKHNSYKPYFFRAGAVGVIAATIVLLFLAASSVERIIATSKSPNIAAVVAATLVNLANGDREGNGLQGLARNSALERAAQMKADDMAKKSYFAHDSPEGHSPWYWFDEAGYTFTYAGENLAVYFSDSSEVEKAWMNSPDHRANILNSHFTEIGIAIAHGAYKGRETIFVVQEFGTPAPPLVSTFDIVSSESRATSTALASTKHVKGVLAVSKPKVIMEDTMFIALQNQIAGQSFNVSTTTKESVWWGRIVTSPFTDLKFAYGVIAVILTLAFALLTLIELRRFHIPGVIYGLFLFILMAGCLYLAEVFMSVPLQIL